MKMPVQLLLFAAAFAVGGCGSVKEFVPIRPMSVPLRMPNQQRIVAEATTEAVNRASADGKLNLSQYKGLKGRVEVNGVFPHSGSDLLDFIASAVEGSMMQAGMLVLPRPHPFSVRAEGGASSVTIIPPPAAPETADAKSDVRLVASVDWGGVDYEEARELLGGRVALAIVLSVLTLGVAGIIYIAVTDFYDHTFTLKSRVHITLRALPTTTNLRGGIGVGEADSKIVIDARSASGYSAEIDIPKKDEK